MRYADVTMQFGQTITEFFFMVCESSWGGGGGGGGGGGISMEPVS